MAIALPSAGSVDPSKSRSGGKKAAKKSGKKGARRGGKSRSTQSIFTALAKANGRRAQIPAAVVHIGEIAGSALVGSALAGWFEGKKGKAPAIGPVDLRLIGGVGALAAGLWREQSNVHFVNIGTGLLTSWLTQKTFAKSAAWGAKSAAKASATTTAVPGGGIVVGRVGVGGAEKRIDRLEGRLEKLRTRQATRGARGAGRVQALGQKFEVTPEEYAAAYARNQARFSGY